jgi:hypothetical protein
MTLVFINVNVEIELFCLTNNWYISASMYYDPSQPSSFSFINLFLHILQLLVHLSLDLFNIIIAINGYCFQSFFFINFSQCYTFLDSLASCDCF